MMLSSGEGSESLSHRSSLVSRLSVARMQRDGPVRDAYPPGRTDLELFLARLYSSRVPMASTALIVP